MAACGCMRSLRIEVRALTRRSIIIPRFQEEIASSFRSPLLTGRSGACNTKRQFERSEKSL